MSKPRVALLGANSQVATEVALFSTLADDLELIGFVRSDYSAAMLKLLGIKFVTIDYDCLDKNNKDLLASCDLIVDFSYPSVQTQEILPAIRHMTAAIIQSLRNGTQYAYMSSIAAFGMPPESSEIRRYIIPRNTYAFIKRRAERLVAAFAKNKGIVPYIFRLGQVHGVLQSVTKYFAECISLRSVTVTGRPNSLCNIIFPHSIYHAIARCARRELIPNTTYALVASPQWSLRTLFDYYREQLQSPCEIIYVGSTPRRQDLARGAPLLSALVFSRGILEPAVMTIYPNLLPRMKAWYRRRAISSPARANGSPDILNIVGNVPCPVVEGIYSSVKDTILAQSRIEDKLQTTLQRNTK